MSREMISVGIVAIFVIIALVLITAYTNSLNTDDLTGVAVSEICISNNQCSFNKRCVNNVCREMFVGVANPQPVPPFRPSIRPPIESYIYTSENFFIPITPQSSGSPGQNLNGRDTRVKLGSSGSGDVNG